MVIEHMRKGVWISTSQIAQILTTGSDLLLVGKLLGPSAAVPYSCTGKLAGVLANKPQIMMQAAFPGLSELRGGGSKPRIRHATMALSQAMLAVSGGVACVVLAVNRGFVEWWIGPSQYGGGLLTLLIVIAMLLRHWNLTFSYSLFSFGYERRLALTGLADGCVSVIVSAILIRLVGPIGGPLGMLTGTCLVNMPANLAALAREMETSAISIVSSSLGWASRLVLASAGASALAALWTPQGFFPVAALALCAAALYLGLLFPILLREPLGTYLRPRLRVLPAQFQRILPASVD
jgi:O-antigen/teichoic acid export membrane protein